VDKEFGANGFYSDAFPDQREHTATIHSAVSSQMAVGRWNLLPRINYRRHYADFLPDYRDPAFYRNETVSHVLGGGVLASRPWSIGTFSVSGEGSWEHLESDDLGTHQRYRGGVLAEQIVSLWNRVTVTPGLMLSYVSHDQWGLWPGVDLSVRLTDWLRVCAGVDYSYRVPTFTELYYDSPANAGSEDLGNEKSLSCEAGVHFRHRAVRGEVTAFARDGSNVIDWVRVAGQRRWVAGGVDEVDVSGGQTEWTVTLNGPFARQPLQVGAGYTLLDVVRDSRDLRKAYDATLGDSVRAATAQLPLQYKYGDDFLRHAATLRVDHSLLLPLRLNWRLRYEVRNGSDQGDWLFDLTAYMHLSRMSLHVSATNILDEVHMEIGSIPGPGRRISGGVEVSFAEGRK